MVRRYLLTILFILTFLISFAQTKSEIVRQRIEFIAQDMEVENISLENLVDVFNYYYDHPMNLNSASKSELQELMLINDFQINSLLKYREDHGPFKTLFEIKDLDYWNLQTLKNIIPFVRVSKVEEKKNKKSNFKKYLKEGELEAYFRYSRDLEQKAGYKEVSKEEKEKSSKYYWGSPAKLYSRIRFTHEKDLDIGVTMEKDPGEQFFGEKQPYGFDFYSAHAYYSGGKYLKKAVIGDYQVQIGQGLAFWTGFGFSKTADAGSAKKNGNGIDAYTSSSESLFLRGAGVELGLGNFSLTVFGSYKGVDGSIEAMDTIDNEQARKASSINISGYHRTTSELERRNSIKELIYGTYFKYETRTFHVGISAVQQGYNTYYQRSDRLINKYRFRGKSLLNLSADYAWIYRNLSLYGEVAQSRDTKSVAFLQGLTVALGRTATISAVYRHYPKDYHTFYARGFGESSNTINESGIYLGTSIDLSKDWTISSYIDFFESPWLGFRVDAPSDGNEWLTQLEYSPSSRLSTYLRVKETNKMQNVSGFEGNMRPVEEYKQRKYQYGLNKEFGGNWEWRSRVDFVTDQRESKGFQKGFALSQALLYRNDDFPLQVSLSYAIFNTDSYDTRVYEYEYNLENVFSIPAYSGKGSRAYVLLRYTFFKERCDLWARYAIFVYDQEGTIGSGAGEIQGNVKSEIGIQLRIRL